MQIEVKTLAPNEENDEAVQRNNPQDNLSPDEKQAKDHRPCRTHRVRNIIVHENLFLPPE